MPDRAFIRQTLIELLEADTGEKHDGLAEDASLREGLGLDSVYDVKFYIENFARKNMEKYRTGGYFKGTPQFAQVDVIPQVAGLLLDSGWSAADVKDFLGENWLRVLGRIW